MRGRYRGDRPHRRDTPPPPPEVSVVLHVEEHGAESLARQIKTTGRAYPLFDIAAMILQKPERYYACFGVKKGADGNTLQPLFACALDDSLWLSEDEAVAHVLRHHLATFYQTERTEIEPPKGTYTFVAQCGMSGVILGPPNHHDYQARLHELHARQFSRLPFEVYKSRVKIVRDEAVVKQWLDEQSWKTEYICLNVPEAARLPDRVAVEQHFRKVHLPTIIRQTESHRLTGPACNKLRGGLWRAYRAAFDQQRRFPMQMATSLSQQFASHGLQFFKVNKTVTHVWVARPTFLDLENEPVSENVRSIVQFINEHPKCTRRQLVETLAPSPPPGTGTEAAKGESQVPAGVPPEHAEPTAEQAAIIGDLHWLIHQGHVIEFANGLMETAKKPAPKRQKAAPKPVKLETEVEARPAAPSKTAEEPKPQSKQEATTDQAVPAQAGPPEAAEVESAEASTAAAEPQRVSEVPADSPSTDPDEADAPPAPSSEEPPEEDGPQRPPQV